MGDQPRLYSTSEVAERLNITPHRVRQLMTALQVGRRVGQHYVFTDADLEILRRRRTTRGPEPKGDNTP